MLEKIERLAHEELVVKSAYGMTVMFKMVIALRVSHGLAVPLAAWDSADTLNKRIYGASITRSNRNQIRAQLQHIHVRE